MPYPAYGFADLFLPDGGVTPYPVCGFAGLFLPDGGVNALSGLRVCGHLFAAWRQFCRPGKRSATRQSPFRAQGVNREPHHSNLHSKVI